MQRIMNILRKNWFTLGVSVFIFLAWIKPDFGSKGGYLKPETTVKYFVVVVIFFISGLSLRTEDLMKTIFRYNIHLFIQSFTLVCVPFLVYILVTILEEIGFNEGIVKGLTVVSCMPPPVSSAVILTKAAGGNEAVAVFNSVLGSFLGVFITPMLLLVTVGSATVIPLSSTILQLASTIILPLIIGQCLRYYIVLWINRNRDALTAVGSFMLLLIIYATFCDTFAQEKSQLQLSTIVITVIIVILIQAALLYIVMVISSIVNQCNPAESVAIMFCATHKSLTLGIPILRILYEDNPQLLEITFPLLVYHPTQILFGSCLISRLRKWIKLEWCKEKTLDV